jgi:hypothetical protein
MRAIFSNRVSFFVAQKLKTKKTPSFRKILCIPYLDLSYFSKQDICNLIQLVFGTLRPQLIRFKVGASINENVLFVKGAFYCYLNTCYNAIR